jgi:excisionase family DNA binding protein
MGAVQTNPTTDDAPVATFVRLTHMDMDRGRKFNSSKPNQALAWAFVDDTPGRAEERELAEAIVEAWKPGPWRGQVWKARIHEPNSKPERVWVAPSVDGVWSGRDWLPYTKAIAVDKPLVYSEPSKASVGLTEQFKSKFNDFGELEGLTIEDQELNAACDMYAANPETERENLWLTVAAYVRKPSWVKQHRKLMGGKPEFYQQDNDVFMQFTAEIFNLLPKYKHEGKMHCWISSIWGRTFFPRIRSEAKEYLNATKFMSHLAPEDPGYVRRKSEVSSVAMSTDISRAEANGEVDAPARFIKDMLDPQAGSPFYGLSPASKRILQGPLEGETINLSSKRIGVSERQARRLLEAAIAEAKAINEDQGSNIVCIDASEDYGGYVGDISACAAEESAFEPLLSVPEAAKLLCIHPKTLQALARSGEVPCLRMGKYWRFRASALNVWVENRLIWDHQSRRVS